VASQTVSSILSFLETTSTLENLFGLFGAPSQTSTFYYVPYYYYGNSPYVASQTANQYVAAGGSVSFSLAPNTFVDPRGAALTYAAMQANGKALPSWLSFNAKTMTFTGTEPTPASPVSIVVTATDTYGLSTSEVFLLTTPSAPVLQAQTAAQHAATGSTVQFTLPSATFADPQGSKLTYTATLANGQSLASWLSFNASTLTFTGTAPATATSLSIKLTATDTFGLSSSETFTLAIGAAPVLGTQTANQTWTAGQAVTLTLPANLFTDPQNSSITLSATQSNGAALPSWLRFNATTGTFSGTIPAGNYGTLGLKVTATDALGLSASETFSAKILGAPILSAQTTSQYAASGHAISFTLAGNTFVDPQGSALTYGATLSDGTALPSWLTFNATTHSFTGTEPASGSPITIKVSATDTYGLSASETFTLAPAAAPVLASPTGAQTWSQGQRVSFTLPSGTFTDPQGSKLTYAATLSDGSALPSWLSFNSTSGLFSGTVPTGTSGLSLKVTATDSYGLSAAETFAVATPAAPTPSPSSGLVINVSYDSSVSSAPAGFKTAVAAAVSALESEFTNNVTLNIKVGWGEVNGQAISSGSAAESMHNVVSTNYNAILNAMTATASSPDDTVAVATVASEASTYSGLSFLMSSAEAKALGIAGGNNFTYDGMVGLSSTTSFTFDPNNRAVAGQVDAIGVLEHEITEVMGRTGSLNYASPGYTPLDLFRFSAAGVHDTTPATGYFSIDGQTMLQQYNNPLNGGDVADWVSSVKGDSFGSAYTGVTLAMSATDIREMNVLGWTRASLTS
jgi:Putative Ig domain